MNEKKNFALEIRQVKVPQLALPQLALALGLNPQTAGTPNVIGFKKII